MTDGTDDATMATEYAARQEPAAILRGQPRIYDRNGTPISQHAYDQLCFDHTYKRVASTYFPRVWLSTVWLGLDHSWHPGEGPLIFETMTFVRRKRHRAKEVDWQITQRYSSEQQALAGHRRWADRIRALGVEALLREQIPWS